MRPLSLYPPAFQIGARPRPIEQPWLMPDDATAAHIADKKRVLAAEPENRYFMARADTLEAQGSVWERLKSHLPTIAPDRYAARLQGVTLDGELVSPNVMSPLLAASMLVGDDLVLMRRHDDGWRLVAAGLFAPSYWNLSEKYDRPLQVMHETVPGFGPGSRNAEIINRMFDMMADDVILERRNWSFHAEGDWFTPGHHPHHLLSDGVSDDLIANMFVRREYQTISKVPDTGDVLFTINVTTQQLREVRGQVDALELAQAIRKLNADQRQYKGLEAGRERLASYLAAQ
ncbi:MAG: heme-dependent oxidative N-demethylase subunit alpha family protein [Pseudomonadota bacterium]